jgi:hypothetical protein
MSDETTVSFPRKFITPASSPIPIKDESFLHGNFFLISSIKPNSPS